MLQGTLGAPSRASFEALSNTKGSLLGSKLFAATQSQPRGAQFPQPSRGSSRLAISASVATEVDTRSYGASGRRSLEAPTHVTVRIVMQALSAGMQPQVPRQRPCIEFAAAVRPCVVGVWPRVVGLLVFPWEAPAFHALLAQPAAPASTPCAQRAEVAAEV